ncbi:hypothetical protein DRO32_04645, partial [Candidatus Bathyarchaeota archaeon]
HEEDVYLSISVLKLKTRLTLSVEPEDARSLDDLSIYVALEDELGRPVPGSTVQLSLDGLPIGVLTTDGLGEANTTLRLEVGPGQHELEAFFQGSDVYEGSSASAAFSVRARGTELEVGYPREAGAGEEISVEALLLDEDGVPVANATLRLYVLEEGSWALLGEAITGPDGRAIFRFSLEEGEHELKVVFEGSVFYRACEEHLKIKVGPPAGAPGQLPPSSGGGGSSVVVGTTVSLASAVAVGLALALLRRRR